ncbi:hypothetical protein LCGC14_0878380 [marine sediment metagenome]|uniref:Uncharacterized protein n=1 Tax=marine sediment metagenome TaxID=412755 RepID=A0A0F9S9M9_9ZZZZ
MSTPAFVISVVTALIILLGWGVINVNRHDTVDERLEQAEQRLDALEEER